MEQYPARPVACESPAWHDCYSDYYIEPKFNGWRILIDQERKEVSGKGSFIVIDACEPVPYDKRRKLFEHLEVASFEARSNALMRMPNLDHSKLRAIWQEMDFQNNKAGETIFEGFVMKKDTKYPWTQKPSYFSPQWHKMRIRS